jgi:hypothetical protein
MLCNIFVSLINIDSRVVRSVSANGCAWIASLGQPMSIAFKLLGPSAGMGNPSAFLLVTAWFYACMVGRKEHERSSMLQSPVAATQPMIYLSDSLPLCSPCM